MNTLLQKIFPYGMQEQEDGTWVFFNRSYKPAGLNLDYSPWVEYKDYPVNFRLKELDRATVAKLSVDGSDTPHPRGMEGENMIHFYDDESNPMSSEDNMAAYLKKLEILMRLKPDDAK